MDGRKTQRLFVCLLASFVLFCMVHILFYWGVNLPTSLGPNQEYSIKKGGVKDWTLFVLGAGFYLEALRNLPGGLPLSWRLEQLQGEHLQEKAGLMRSYFLKGALAIMALWVVGVLSSLKSEPEHFRIRLYVTVGMAAVATPVTLWAQRSPRNAAMASFFFKMLLVLGIFGAGFLLTLLVGTLAVPLLLGHTT